MPGMRHGCGNERVRRGHRAPAPSPRTCSAARMRCTATSSAFSSSCPSTIWPLNRDTCSLSERWWFSTDRRTAKSCELDQREGRRLTAHAVSLWVRSGGGGAASRPGREIARQLPQGSEGGKEGGVERARKHCACFLREKGRGGEGEDSRQGSKMRPPAFSVPPAQHPGLRPGWTGLPAEPAGPGMRDWDNCPSPTIIITRSCTLALGQPACSEPPSPTTLLGAHLHGAALSLLGSQPALVLLQLNGQPQRCGLATLKQ